MIFRDESIEFITKLASKIILGTEYENYINNTSKEIDIVDDNDDKSTIY